MLDCNVIFQQVASDAVFLTHRGGSFLDLRTVNISALMLRFISLYHTVMQR